MKIQPPKLLQLIFHRGAKKLEQPAEKLIQDPAGLLAWKENDRAIATFNTAADIVKAEQTLTGIVKDWVEASR